VRGTTVGINLGPITQCSISYNNEWIAFSKEREIWIIRLKVPYASPTLALYLTMQSLKKNAIFQVFAFRRKAGGARAERATRHLT